MISGLVLGVEGYFVVCEDTVVVCLVMGTDVVGLLGAILGKEPKSMHPRSPLPAHSVVVLWVGVGLGVFMFVGVTVNGKSVCVGGCDWVSVEVTATKLVVTLATVVAVSVTVNCGVSPSAQVTKQNVKIMPEAMHGK